MYAFVKKGLFLLRNTSTGVNEIYVKLQSAVGL